MDSLSRSLQERSDHRHTLNNSQGEWPGEGSCRGSEKGQVDKSGVSSSQPWTLSSVCQESWIHPFLLCLLLIMSIPLSPPHSASDSLPCSVMLGKSHHLSEFLCVYKMKRIIRTGCLLKLVLATHRQDRAQCWWQGCSRKMNSSLPSEQVPCLYRSVPGFANV